MKDEKIKAFINAEFEGKEKIKKEDRAKILISRGLTDENLIIEILKNESPVPKRLPAEMYDKFNYTCRQWTDRIAHFEIDYDFIPNVSALKNVIICLFESAPVFHSSFIDNHICPYWKVENYHIDDILLVKETNDLQQSADDFLLSDIDVKNNVQIKIALFSCGTKSKLCFILNHMCMDGGDHKRFMNDLFRAYDRYVQNQTIGFFNKNLSRAYSCVYNDFDKNDQRKAKCLFGNVSTRDKHFLPLSKKHEKDKKMIVRKIISREIFEPAKEKAKRCGATVNDLVSAAYIRAFYEVSGCNPDERVGISCAVDLRRYMNNYESFGYTNHTTYMPCIIEAMGETMVDTLKAVVKSTKEAKSDKFMGLHGLPLLNIGYSTMIYAQVELIVKLFYNNSFLSISNIGEIASTTLSLGGNPPTAVAAAGSTKEKPCAAMNVLSYNGDLVLSICINGNEDDRKMLSEFLDKIEKNIKEM